MHLRAPSIAHGIVAFAWAAFFFLFLWLGMISVGVDRATALVLALVAGCAIFLFVRLAGEERPRRQQPSSRPRGG